MTTINAGSYLSPDNVPFMAMVLTQAKDGGSVTKLSRVITPVLTPGARPKGLLSPPYTVHVQSKDHPHVDLLLELRGTVALGASSEGDDGSDIGLGFWDARNLGVSRRHFQLIPTPKYLSVLDLHSTNGTVHNGTRLEVDRRYRLLPGDRLVAGHLMLIFKQIHRPTVAGEPSAEVTKQLKDTGWLSDLA